MKNNNELKGELLCAVILSIANGNKKALKVLIRLLDSTLELSKLQKLQQLNITDKQFLKLWNHCANQEICTMNATIDILNRNGYSDATIELNLEHKNPLPFVYDNVEALGMKCFDYRLPNELDQNPEANYQYCLDQEREFWHHYNQREEENLKNELKKLTKVWRI